MYAVADFVNRQNYREKDYAQLIQENDNLKVN